MTPCPHWEKDTYRCGHPDRCECLARLHSAHDWPNPEPPVTVENPDFFKLAGRSLDMQTTITKWGFEDLGDDPAKHRWRAWWAGDGKQVWGVSLEAYPVIKVNAASVWIDEWGDRGATKQPWEDGAPAMEWIVYEGKPVKKRLLHNNSGQAWAKPTQEEALRSLAIRLTRWTMRIYGKQQRAESAIRALEKLRPDWKFYTETARENLKGCPR